MKRIVCLLLVCLLLSGCMATGTPAETKIYEATFLTLFDTVTVVKGSAESKEAFAAIAQSIHDELEKYHQLFDIYNDYEGVTNLKSVNDSAGEGPVVVDRAIIELLLDCKSYYAPGGGSGNPLQCSCLGKSLDRGAWWATVHGAGKSWPQLLA